MVALVTGVLPIIWARRGNVQPSLIQSPGAAGLSTGQSPFIPKFKVPLVQPALVYHTNLFNGLQQTQHCHRHRRLGKPQQLLCLLADRMRDHRRRLVSVILL